jgi:hypothetical protein
MPAPPVLFALFPGIIPGGKKKKKEIDWGSYIAFAIHLISKTINSWFMFIFGYIAVLWMSALWYTLTGIGPELTPIVVPNPLKNNCAPPKICFCS